jgi:hypothetical protein
MSKDVNTHFKNSTAFSVNSTLCTQQILGIMRRGQNTSLIARAGSREVGGCVRLYGSIRIMKASFIKCYPVPQ